MEKLASGAFGAFGCVLNDLYREAAALGIELTEVRVIAAGGFDTATWRSKGISYSVEVSSDPPAGQIAHLLEAVEHVAEIPQTIRAGAAVRRVRLSSSLKPGQQPGLTSR